MMAVSTTSFIADLRMKELPVQTDITLHPSFESSALQAVVLRGLRGLRLAEIETEPDAKTRKQQARLFTPFTRPANGPYKADRQEVEFRSCSAHAIREFIIEE